VNEEAGLLAGISSGTLRAMFYSTPFSSPLIQTAPFALPGTRMRHICTLFITLPGASESVRLGEALLEMEVERILAHTPR
jgi:hypothetical protein